MRRDIPLLLYVQLPPTMFVYHLFNWEAAAKELEMKTILETGY